MTYKQRRRAAKVAAQKRNAELREMFRSVDGGPRRWTRGRQKLARILR